MLQSFSDILGRKAYYTTPYGEAYLGDSANLLKLMPTESFNLVITSPPFALIRKKAYDNVSAENYVDWFLPFGQEIYRLLKHDGSLVIQLGGSWIPHYPVKHLYQFKLLLTLCDKFGYNLAQDIYWFNKAKLPTPAQWVTVKKIRLKDAVDCIWWLSKSKDPKADNRRVLKEYSSSMRELLKNGYNAGPRPSGHIISNKFGKDNKGAIMSNFLDYSNTQSQSQYLHLCKKFGITPHPARFPMEIPLFFIKFLTDENDLVLDPFAGSNATGEASERLRRRWLSIEIKEEYVGGSKLRFFPSI